jgi:hypothetical protein
VTTQYTPILKLALPVTGELSGTWGTVVNDNITSMVEQAVAGLSTINTWTANAHTLTTADGTSSEARCAMLVLATGAGGTALTAAGEVICPAASKLYVVKNGTSFAVTVKTSAGTGVAIPAGDTAFVFCDGTNVNACVTTIVNGHISGNLTVDGNTTLGDATSDTITATARFNTDLLPSTDNARDLGSTANSWRTLYCETSVIAANITISGNTISSTDTNGNITLAPNGTGDVQLDADTIRVGDSGANVTITSNGAGDLILNTNSGTNSGSITIEDGANGNIALTPNGTGQVTISTALDLTNLEVTNIKAKDGTAGMQLADSTGVVSFTANPILSGGTANGVAFLNASKVLTTGSALTFDGTKLIATATTGAATTYPAYFDNSGGGVGTGARIGFRNTAVSYGEIGYLYDGAFATIIDSAQSGQTRFLIQGTEQARLTSSGLEIKQSQLIGYSSFAGIGSNGLAVLGNVGIGTNAPGAKLDVAGTVLFTGGGVQFPIQFANSFAPNAERADILVASNATSNNTIRIGSIASNAGVTIQGTRQNDSSLKVNLVFQPDGGNLGIGASPTARLSIGDPGTGLDFTNAASGNFNIGLLAGTGSALAYIFQRANSDLLFGTSNTEKVRLTSTGTLNIVGAGTAGSTQAISFNGSTPVDTLVTTSGGNVGIGTNAPSLTGLAILSGGQGKGVLVARNATGSPTSGQSLGSYAFKGVMDGVNSNVAAEAMIEAVAAENQSGSTAATNLLFYTKSSGTGPGSSPTLRMTLDSSGNLGLGVAPSAGWNSGKAIELGQVQGNAIWGLGINSLYLVSNARWDGSNYVYTNNGPANLYGAGTGNGTFTWYTAPSGTANTTTITNGVSYTIITSGNQTAFGAANNNVGTVFTATSSGTLSSGTVSQNIAFTQAMTLANNGTLLLGTTTDSLASAGNFTLGSSKPGGETDALVYNPSNTAASRARVWISNGGTSAGSANLLFTSGLAGTRLVMGVDSTDGDKFKIGNGYSVGSGTTYVLLDTSGNLLLGGTVSPASATKSFSLFNGTVPTGSVTDGCVLYTEDVSSSSELKVRDEAGNVTTLSPHNFDLIPEGPSEEMAWSYYSERDGKRINVDMLKAIRLLEKLSGEKLVHFA